MSKQLVLSKSQTQLKVVEADLKTTITQHAGYVDLIGKASSGSKGLAMQINIRVKNAFGDARESFTESKRNLLITMQLELIRLIAEGEAKKLLRAEIKKGLYATIDNYGELARKLV